MKDPKPGDSPSGYNREVYAVRHARSSAARELDEYLFRVKARALALMIEQPHLQGEDPRTLFSRYIVPETSPGYDSVLRRAAFALLHLRAVDRSEMADPTSGDEAA